MINKAFFLLSLLFISSCTDLNNSYPSGPYSDPSYGGYGGGYYPSDGYYRRREWERQRREAQALEREREKLEEEREDFEEERERSREAANNPPPPPPPPAPERCPPGYSPSEQKCSPQERKRGCKDMRLPGGLGCVRR